MNEVGLSQLKSNLAKECVSERDFDPCYGFASTE